MGKDTREPEQKPAQGNDQQAQKGSEPVEFAPNSTQPVEAMDKSSQTHNSGSQQRALQENENREGTKFPAHPGQAAAQHATGSFSGTAEASSDIEKAKG